MKTLPVNGSFALPELPYSKNDLEPVISEATIGYHYGKHFQTYINNLNALLPQSGFEGRSLEEIIAQAAPGGLYNNAGQSLNHKMYFEQFKAPAENNLPLGNFAAAVDKQFGSFEAFREAFAKAAAGLFGSGWAWLSCDKEGRLYITQESNAGNPVKDGKTPLLTFDVWEHAYYLDYQNARPNYIKEVWKIIDWNVVENRFNGR